MRALLLLREDEIDLSPVLLRRRALGGPVRRMIELVGHLRRPVATDVTVEEIALDRLTEPRGAARAIGLPAWREHHCAAQRNMRRTRLLRHTAALQCHDVVLRLGVRRRAVLAPDVLLNAHSLAIEGLQMGHPVPPRRMIRTERHKTGSA